MMLDKGQREDWFASDFIIILTIIAIVAFVLFIFVELTTEHPIVDLKVFLSYSFLSGNIVMFFVLAGLFGSIILLPIYLQGLMGYTASKAGMILGPGGLAIFLVMPIVGWLNNVVNPKSIVAIGIVIFAYANYLMSGFNMQADFMSIIWPRIVMSISLGMIFIPLTTLSLSRIPKEEMGNATSVFGLVRNLGSSVGVAFAATMLSRGTQIHQSYLSEHITLYDLNYWNAANQSSQLLSRQGMDPVTAQQGGAGVIYNELLRQAYMMSFNDAFFILAIMMICMLPFILFIRHVNHSAVKP
jgi:DHA2 family multidrug resistance protein